MLPAKFTSLRAMADTVEVAKLILAGHILVLAGAEKDLSSLPAGNWIGGTVASFLIEGRVVRAEGKLIYADLSTIALKAEARRLSAQHLHNLSAHYPDNGFAVIILPGHSAVLKAAAIRMPDWPGLYNAPLVGWVSAVPLGELGQTQPKIFCGNGTARNDSAALMYVTLPQEVFAELNVINPFAAISCPTIRFPAGGYRIKGACLFNGQKADLTHLIAEGVIDPSLPLAASKNGALLGNSIIDSDPRTRMVTFLNPIDPTLTYRFAEPLPAFNEALTTSATGIDLAEATIASICVTSLRHMGGSAHPILPAIAPVTFGQIGYTVLTQAISCLSLYSLGSEF